MHMDCIPLDQEVSEIVILSHNREEEPLCRFIYYSVGVNDCHQKFLELGE